ncbi:MAG TPA: valine--tRNA ligase [Candidatus Norongarragalinales archaeon]|jgi:valyl-tRNA synthetase|nr:valine--tRNA ligase [Candidatus Norongarragalinales archaeon]
MSIADFKTQKIEEKWQKHWEDSKIHHFDEHETKKPWYVIDTPPPFPTGEFHTGSSLNWCYIDFVARYKRMTGYNVLFPQGWDCHGFPTEVKVEQKFGRLPRAEFREKCLEFTKQNVATIKPQMKQLGFSIDWRHEYWTIDPSYYKKVQLSLVQMFNDGQVYHAQHPVLWSTQCGSAIAKAETEEVQRESKLNYLKFDSDAGELLIATTRPEYLHACVAILINPDDARAKQLAGKTATVPLFGQKVPIIKELDVEKDFGTGLVMLCTFGDKSDVVWAYRHGLPIKRAMDEHGKLLDAGAYTGEHYTKAREKMLEELKAKGKLAKQEIIQQTVRIHDRCKKPVEYLNSAQWFIKVKEHKQLILDTAAEMKWTPAHAQQMLEDWTNGLEWDWCISRQRHFGIPLPFWICKNGHAYAASKEKLPVDPTKDKPPHENCPKCHEELKGETAVADGWVDSSITPLIISGWPDNKKFFEKAYPNALRPQGTDIVRTWAFYTTLRCKLLTGKAPFKEVLVNGMVLGEKDKKKMSKSLGNYVEAKEVMTKYGVDALRQWAALAGHTGKDVVFYLKDVDYGKSFAIKMWNAAKFCERALQDYKPHDKPTALRTVDKWILSRLNKTIQTTGDAMEKQDFFTAITTIQDFFWHEFCDYYLEDVKHRVYGETVEANSKQAAQFALHKVMRTTLGLMAPFAPFTTEELWSELFQKEEKASSLHLTSYPAAERAYINEDGEKIARTLHEIVAQARKFKASKGLALNETLSSAELTVPQDAVSAMDEIDEELRAVARISQYSVKPTKDQTPTAIFTA